MMFHKLSRCIESNAFPLTVQELKDKEKVQLDNPKSGCGCLREQLLMRAFKSQFKQWLMRVVASRALTVFPLCKLLLNYMYTLSVKKRTSLYGPPPKIE